MGKIIGLDLGTTNSVAAYVEGKKPEIILTPEGERLLPSLVAFSKTGERLVGNPAKSQLITNTNTIYSIKRLIGKKFSEVEPYLKQFNYPIVKGKGDMVKMKIDDVLFSPEEISAMILEKLKKAAEQRIDDTIEGAIITVPAYFNDTQRQATKDAGEIAGLDVLRIINEPTAASLAFSLDLSKKCKVVVYDFGGGTIDISVLQLQEDVIKVLATAGDINLGGNDLDIMLSNKLIEEIKREYDMDLSRDKMAMQRIRDASENAKKELSTLEECEINLPFIADTDDGPVHFLRYFTRKEFEKMIEKKIDRTIEICSSALNNADLTIDEIDEILLVGGSTRIPLVQKRIKRFFKKEPNKKVNPDEIVAMGAAIQGSIATGESRDVLLLDVIPLSLGIKTLGGTFTRLIDANTTIPTNRSLVFSTVEDNQKEVEINVYQGEREIAEENKLLGKFSLTNIRPTPKGLSRIEVMFSIDINGILMVTAIDLSTKNKKRVVVTNSGLLSKEEIRRIKNNAEKFKESDLKKKELIKVKNEIINYVYAIKKFLKSQEIDLALAVEAKSLIESAKTAIEKEQFEELEEIHIKIATMNLKLSKITTSIIHNNSIALAENFEAHDTTENSEFLKGYDENEIVLIEEGRKRIQKTGTGGNKDVLKLKQKILRAIYNIEQYINNLELDHSLLSECKILINRANNEIDNENLRELEDLDRETERLYLKLDAVVGAVLGFSEKNEEETDTDKVRFKNDDTNPYKIFKE